MFVFFVPLSSFLTLMGLEQYSSAALWMFEDDMFLNSKHSWKSFFFFCSSECVSPWRQVGAHKRKCACQLYISRTGLYTVLCCFTVKCSYMFEHWVQSKQITVTCFQMYCTVWGVCVMFLDYSVKPSWVWILAFCLSSLPLSSVTHVLQTGGIII